MKKQEYQIDMCSGGLAGKILLFALPLMASSLLQLLFNAADIVVVGKFVGKEALAAVGSNTSLINLLTSLFAGLSVGANVTLARDMGAGKLDAVNRGVHTAVLLALISGLVLTVAGVTLAPHLLLWMKSPEDVIELGSLYLRIYFLGMPATMAYNFGSAVLRAQGDTRRPLYYLMLAGVANVAMNLFFVIVLNMGVAGVGAATAISQYISAGLVLRCLMKEQGELKLDLKQLRIDPVVVKRIMQVGLPAGFQGIVFALSNVAIQSSVNSFGSTVMSGSAAAQNIESFVYAAMNTFYQAALTFVGQNYGAGKCKRVDRVTLYCQSFAILTGLVLGNLVYFFGPSLISIYVQPGPEQEAIIQAGMIRLSRIGRMYALCGIMDTMVGSLRGIGYSVGPMVVSLLGSCVLRLVWVYTIFPLDPTPSNLFLSYPITWTITGAVQLAMYLAVRKRAFARVQGNGPSYLAVDGQHPQITK
jgi:putative MATE family efflux protein